MRGGFLAVLIVLGLLNGSGPAGGLPLRKAGRPTVSRGFVARGCGWLVRVGVGNTPVMLLLPACVGSVAWWVPPRALVCGGGMLSGFWGSAPWLPGPSGAPGCWGFLGGCGWVGCELYSGREHLTVRFLRQNCFLFCSCVFVVCFFERSVDALASGADEGRGGLRYSSGSRLAGCDPRVSEWGDPARVMSCHLHLNCIGCGG